MPGQYHRGSFVCPHGHELRVTCRCIRDDFGQEPPLTFDQLCHHQIVVALREKRSTGTKGSKTVGPAAGDRTIYHLARGNDHRGATWFDESERVVWLCAYRLHRSGAADDAFPYFHELILSGRIWPVEEDYLWLERDQAIRFGERLPTDAAALLASARAAPAKEHRGHVGGDEVGLLIEVVETLEETYIAFDLSLLVQHRRFIAVLVAFYPQRSFDEWLQRDSLPSRALTDGEMCLSILHS